MAAVWAAGPEPIMATLVCGVDILVVTLEEKVEGREEEKVREGAVEKGFLCAAVVGLGLS